MNQRIQELAVQAGITTNLDTDYFEKDINKWVDYYSEKLAELIVEECMRMCEVTQMGFETHGCSIEASGAITVKEYIAEHFGVE